MGRDKALIERIEATIDRSVASNPAVPCMPRAVPTRSGKRNKSTYLQGLFPSEDEIAHRLNQTTTEWAAKSLILERDGLPRVDPLMGGRYWPSVKAYFNRRYSLSSIEPFQPDGEENLDAI